MTDQDAYFEGDSEEIYAATDVLKWVADGSPSISEAIDRIEGFVAHLKELKAKGWEIIQPVDGGWFQYNHDENGNPLPPEAIA